MKCASAPRVSVTSWLASAGDQGSASLGGRVEGVMEVGMVMTNNTYCLYITIDKIILIIKFHYLHANFFLQSY